MITINKNNFANTIVLLLGVLICGSLSVRYGKELCWDLAHYHYYNPYVFFHDRSMLDFLPSTFVHQYINPAIDFLTYFLIEYFSPKYAVFILSAIHGINIFLLFVMARFFIQGKFANIGSFLLALLGMFSANVLTNIGSFQNDNLIAIFILACVLLQLKVLNYYIKNRSLPKMVTFVAGLILGLGFGLKLTAGVFVTGFFVATLVSPVRLTDRIQLLILSGIGVVSGFAITAGYWSLMMWQQHHNPIFPYFNGIFHASGFAADNWRDMRFLPKGIWQTIFYPFYFSFNGKMVSDGTFVDVRFIFVYLLFVVAGLKWLYLFVKNHGARDETYKTPVTIFWLYAFYISSYIVWQFYFSLIRYIAPLEMLAPLIIFLLLRQLITNHFLKVGLLMVIFEIIILFMKPVHTVRTHFFGESFFNVRMPESVKNIPHATVLIGFTAYVNDLNPRPQIYLIPFFPTQWHFIGIPFWHEKYLFDAATDNHIRDLLDRTNEKIFLLTSDLNMPELIKAGEHFGFMMDGTCAKIYSDRQAITHQDVLLCPVKRLT